MIVRSAAVLHVLVGFADGCLWREEPALLEDPSISQTGKVHFIVISEQNSGADAFHNTVGQSPDAYWHDDWVFKEESHLQYLYCAGLPWWKGRANATTEVCTQDFFDVLFGFRAPFTVENAPPDELDRMREVKCNGKANGFSYDATKHQDARLMGLLWQADGGWGSDLQLAVLAPYLGQRGIRVLILRRHNDLAHFIENPHVGMSDEAQHLPKRMTVPIADVEAFSAEKCRRYRTALQVVREHQVPHIHLWYEEFFGSVDKAIELFAFLGTCISTQDAKKLEGSGPSCTICGSDGQCTERPCTVVVQECGGGDHRSIGGFYGFSHGHHVKGTASRLDNVHAFRRNFSHECMIDDSCSLPVVQSAWYSIPPLKCNCVGNAFLHGRSEERREIEYPGISSPCPGDLPPPVERRRKRVKTDPKMHKKKSRTKHRSG